MTGCAFFGGLLWGCRKEQLIHQRMLKSSLISLTSGQAGNVPLGKRGLGTRSPDPVGTLGACLGAGEM